MMLLLSKEIRPVADVVLREIPVEGRDLERDFSYWEKCVACVPLFLEFLKNTLTLFLLF
jgi:hypothetical protein